MMKRIFEIFTYDIDSANYFWKYLFYSTIMYFFAFIFPIKSNLEISKLI